MITENRYWHIPLTACITRDQELDLRDDACQGRLPRSKGNLPDRHSMAADVAGICDFAVSDAIVQNHLLQEKMAEDYQY